METTTPTPTTSETLSSQIDRLAKFIMEEIDGEPSESEGAVDCAIRVMRKLKDRRDYLSEMWAAQIALNTETFKKNERCVDSEAVRLDDFMYLLRSGAYLREHFMSGKTADSADSQFEFLQDTVEKWIVNYCTAMLQEIAELRDSTNWKWWRSKVDKFDLQNIWVELVDILHFWMSACMVSGLSPKDVFKMYFEKNKVNFERQASGYRVKDEDDCKHIAPK